MTKMSFDARLHVAIVAFSLMFSLLAAGGEASGSAIVVPNSVELKNPATEISVGFGDVSLISPWRVRRRHPRATPERGGLPVTLREALDALNVAIARDEEMPERTFKFADDGSLSSICDIPFGPVTTPGGTMSIVVRFNGMNEAVSAEAPGKTLLDTPVGEFSKVEFLRIADGAQASAETPAAVRKTGDVKTIILPGGVKMEMIWCEPGTYMMGSPVDEAGRFDDEPLHLVTLTKGFWLGKYEVTQEQWEAVMGNNRSRFRGKNRPVDNVSWDDCQNFVRAVNAMMDGLARLPTEAEWEYACRAGSTQAVSGSGHLGDMAWYDSNSGSQTHEVGRNQPNAWGFYDMHGNVLEWCADWFSHPDGQAIDPHGPPSGAFRVLRGGCWFFYERDCRSAYRLKRDPDLRNCIFGFRLACSEREG